MWLYKVDRTRFELASGFFPKSLSFGRGTALESIKNTGRHPEPHMRERHFCLRTLAGEGSLFAFALSVVGAQHAVPGAQTALLATIYARPTPCAVFAERGIY
jgi:hypothetical protein